MAPTVLAAGCGDSSQPWIVGDYYLGGNELVGDVMTDTPESLERRLKAMDDEDGDSRYITDDDDIWYISGDMLAALKEKDADNERLRDALERLDQWSKAYPIDIFPEPDLKDARVGLAQVGITLDQVSASNMRHVIKRVGEIARAALEGEKDPHAVDFTGDYEDPEAHRRALEGE